VATLFLPGVRREDSGKGVMSDLACAFFIAATLLAIVLLVLFHQDNGKSVGMWHIAGSVATFAAGTMAWFVPGLTGNARNGQKPTVSNSVRL
jgi:cell division protein FtsW (lipid II flippase)